MDVPPWWEWELDFSPHAERRMAQRGLLEIALREMLRQPTAMSPDAVEGRWVVAAEHRGRRWEIIVEPDPELRLIVVISAYCLELRR